MSRQDEALGGIHAEAGARSRRVKELEEARRLWNRRARLEMEAMWMPGSGDEAEGQEASRR